jgi:carboxymethylenebutenolidase
LIDVETEHGSMPVYLTRREAPGSHPLVLLYMDAPGIRDDLHEAARRLADAGYTAVLPDLFYRLDPADRPDIELLRARDAGELERMAAAVSQLADAEVLADTRTLLERLAAGGVAEAEEPWGCVGFCLGGRLGLRAAAAFGEALAAASLLHPSPLVTDEPESPHRQVASIAGELYLGLGENDHVSPPSAVPPLREELERHHVAHRIEVLPGAEHGYTMPSLPAYNPAAAERAWTSTLELLGRRLPAAAA